MTNTAIFMHKPLLKLRQTANFVSKFQHFEQNNSLIVFFCQHLQNTTKTYIILTI